MHITLRLYFIPICVIIICEGVSPEEPNLLQLPNYRSIGRYRRQSKCRLDEFMCKSGQCVVEDAECDGMLNCEDGSDESDCTGFRCAGNLFQCTYGACIKRSLMCDGKQDCKDNSDETTPLCKSRVTTKPPSNCGNREFKCNSGQCIDEELLCDGKADCIDDSDETVKECKSIPCSPQNFFQCDYGACISKALKCNGIRNCVDGSDEKNCPGAVATPTTAKTPTTPKTKTTKKSPTTPKTTVPPPSGSCQIPTHPANGEYKIGTSDLKPGDYAPNFGALLVNCKNGYKVNPTLKSVFPLCMNGQWMQELPTCERACPSIRSSSTTSVRCKYRGAPLKNCEDPVEDTIATLSCEALYEEPGISNNPIRICKDGNWDYPIPQCLPICGQKRPKGVANVVGGQIAKENDYPWHVGVYETNDNYLCGGSIISLKVILSAAHCFCDPNGNRYPAENYKIAAGKYHRDFNDVRDRYAQSSSIHEIYIPQRYKGIISNYADDIAVVVLETPFKISVAVQPVCLDRSSEFEHLQLSVNSVGIVVGWGFTDYDGNLSDQLKEIYVPFKSFTDCFENVTPSFRKFLTYDKICAGYLYENKSVCQGDSGGGLTFEWNQNRYYIRGIVSTSPSSATNGVITCDAERYGTYTQISKHMEFITDTEVINRS